MFINIITLSKYLIKNNQKIVPPKAGLFFGFVEIPPPKADAPLAQKDPLFRLSKA